MYHNDVQVLDVRCLCNQAEAAQEAQACNYLEMWSLRAGLVQIAVDTAGLEPIDSNSGYMVRYQLLLVALSRPVGVLDCMGSPYQDPSPQVVMHCSSALGGSGLH